MRFASKVDAWLIWFVRLSFATSFLVVVGVCAAERKWETLLWTGGLLAVVQGFIEWIFHTTYYLVESDELRIRSGMFRWRIPIERIESVEPTNNPLSSPALSLDRLDIRYGSKNILVSPEDREGFMAALRAVNPRISGGAASTAAQTGASFR